MSDRPSARLYAFQYAYTLATLGKIEPDDVLRVAKEWEEYLGGSGIQGDVIKLTVVPPGGSSA